MVTRYRSPAGQSVSSVTHDTIDLWRMLPDYRAPLSSQLRFHHGGRRRVFANIQINSGSALRQASSGGGAADIGAKHTCGEAQILNCRLPEQPRTNPTNSISWRVTGMRGCLRLRRPACSRGSELPACLRDGGVAVEK
ncbi:hypothetical protein F2P81_015578 [Scophthalmus maximus]|uniref:Uncharacterized protein n=1 Tax=Scophthalmus maximus TaxID=52904 RepID=A0A6A4SMA9_SCOMX|nr:hypothetical protein F2P81_015578 [Scophthalmus maximus]